MSTRTFAASTVRQTNFAQPPANTAIDFGDVQTADASVMSKESNNVYRLNPTINAGSLTISATMDTYIIRGNIDVDIRYAASAPTSSNIRTHGTSLASRTISGRTIQWTLSGDITTPANGLYFWVAVSNVAFVPNRTLSIRGTISSRPIPPPNTPTGFDVAAGDRGVIDLSWNANTDSVTQYQFKRATSEAGLSSATWNDAGTGTSYADTGLPDSTTYYYQLRAVRDATQSPPTATQSATTADATAPPPDPPEPTGPATVRIVFEPQGPVFYVNKFVEGEAASRELSAYIAFDRNVADLEQSDVTLTFTQDPIFRYSHRGDPAEIIGFEGDNTTYKVTIKLPSEQEYSNSSPLETDSGVLTLNIAENVVEGGNNAATASIRYMTNNQQPSGIGGNVIRIGITSRTRGSLYPAEDVIDFGTEAFTAKSSLSGGIPAYDVSYSEGKVWISNQREGMLLSYDTDGTKLETINVNTTLQSAFGKSVSSPAHVGIGSFRFINGKLFFFQSWAETRVGAARFVIATEDIQTIFRNAQGVLNPQFAPSVFGYPQNVQFVGKYIYFLSRVSIATQNGNWRMPLEFLTDYLDTDKVRPIRNVNTGRLDYNNLESDYLPNIIEGVAVSGPDDYATGILSNSGIFAGHRATSYNDKIYFLCNAGRGIVDASYGAGVIIVTDADFNLIPEETFILTHISRLARGVVAFDDKLLILNETDRNNDPMQANQRMFGYTYELSQYSRPPVRRQLIYPIFVNEGESIDLNDYCKGGVEFLWDVGYEKPSYLSLSGSMLSVAANAVREETAVQVKVKAVNYKGSTDDDNFKFYLVIRKKVAPVWQNIKMLSLKSGEPYELSQLVDAETITAITLPTDATVVDKQLTLLTQGGEVSLRAANGAFTSDVTFIASVDNILDASDYSDIFRYSIEIGGIEIPLDDVLPYPETSADLDPVAVNAYRVGNFTATLKYRNGYYDTDIPGNFWEMNDLNRDGYLEPISVYHENWVQGEWRKNILFSGLVIEPIARPAEEITTLNCVDDAYRLQTQIFQDAGVEKYAKGLQQNTETFEGVYTPERSLLPIVMGSAAGWVEDDKLEIRKERNRPEGIRKENVIYASSQDFRSQGGYLAEEPLVRFKSGYRHIDVKQAIQNICTSAGVHNPDIMISEANLTKPELQPILNIQFPVSNTRIQHVPVDWKHDTANDKRYTLLSNPSDQIGDMLVVYDFQTAIPKIVKVFENTIKVQEFVSEDFDTFYILVCDAFSQDKSGTPTPKDVYPVVSEYDAANPDSNIRILRYVRSTDTLSEYVPSTNSHKPQLGIHYYAGFENQHQLFDWEGVRAETRKSLAIRNGRLYFRYVSGNNFGVAIKDSGIGTAARISAAKDAYHNHLSFAFDVDMTTGYIYFGWTTGTHNRSTLNLQRYARNGVVTNLFSQSVANSELTLLDQDIEGLEVARGGMFSGVHELLFHSGKLYCIVQIQRMLKYRDTDNDEQVSRNANKTAGAVLYAFDVATTTLTPMEKYQFVTNAARSLTVHTDKVFYAEGTDAAYKYKAFNPDDIDSFNRGANQNLFPDLRGTLKSIDPAMHLTSEDADGKRIAIADYGNMYFEGTYYRGMSMPMLSIDNEIHFIASYGNADALQKRNSAASLPGNYMWLKFGDKLSYILTSLKPTTPHALLIDIANKTNSIFYIRNGRVVFKDREPLVAKLDGTLSADATTITLKEQNREFPEEGYLFIGKEIVKYGQGFSIMRGQAGTLATSHDSDIKVTYLDNVVHKDSFLNSSISIDTNRFYNVVQNPSLTDRQEDVESIAQYIEKVFSLDLGLDVHQQVWTEDANKRYLEYLKVIRKLVSVSLKRSNYLNIGDIIAFNYAGKLIYPMRIVSIEHTRESVNVTGRSL